MVTDASLHTTPYVQFYLRKSSFSHTIEKKVEKFDEFLAYIGGFVASLIAIVGFIFSYINRTMLSVNIANKLYSFYRKNIDYSQNKK